MTTSPLFTIIMPVYNAEKYLKTAIDSVLNQTFKDFELIIVNDGSKDTSLAISKDYAVLDNRIHIINLEKNAGLSNARNVGLKQAQGKYITYLDSDDYIDNNILEILSETIAKDNPDAVKFGLYEEYFDQEDKLDYRKKVVANQETIVGKDAIRKRIITWEMLPIFGYTWNTLYKKEILQNLHLEFQQFKMIEDFLYNLSYFENVNKAVMLAVPAYHYAKRNNESLSSKYVQEYFTVSCLKIEKLLEKYALWQLLDKSIERDIYWLYTRYFYSNICRELQRGSLEDAQTVLTETMQTELFAKYLKISFADAPLKVRILTTLLQKRCTFLILGACEIINLVKNNFKSVFVTIKG
jgi:glycosyltransferase involved in cell wall biosynthesis